MKIDRIKEEIANIRRTQNVMMVALIGVIGYFFTTFKVEHDLRMVISAICIILLIFFLIIWSVEMRYKLQELENAKKED